MVRLLQTTGYGLGENLKIRYGLFIRQVPDSKPVGASENLSIDLSGSWVIHQVGLS